ncbi:hypothetical protein [Streptomyces canus]|uniref:hypothetical protein n=1 Tax=Streptomyces canus TaxID=58343 RepID=UPI00278AB079|nr:hypothetical protein [Streptomyces canus]MDQ0765637.1 hypothetical protein [Streptomyces canus]
MSDRIMSADEFAILLQEVNADIERARDLIQPRLSEHVGLDDFTDREFLEVRGTFTSSTFMPNTQENRLSLERRALPFGYDVIGGLDVALLAFQDLPWIAPRDLHALAEGASVAWHARLPWDRLTECPCMASRRS